MPSGVNGLFLSVNDEHRLVFENFLKGIDLVKFFKKPWRRAAQQSWEGKYLFKDHRKVIAVADPALATTIPIPVELVREPSEAKLPITVPELENLIAQEMAKIFNGCRTEAAARLHVHELDAMLVGEKARAFRVDGDAVMDPAGFTGKKVTLLLELTFTGREIFEKLKQFFNAPEDFYFAESPQSRLVSLSRVRKEPLNLVFADEAGDVIPATSSLFVFEEGRGKSGYPVLYRETFAWSFARVFGRIASALGVDTPVARELYAAYCSGGFSDAAARVFKHTIDPAFDELFAEISKKKLRGFLYVDAPYGMPFPLPHRHGEAVFEPMPLVEVLETVGFAEGISSGGGKDGAVLSEHTLSRHLLPFIEAYFDKSDTELNRKLRRRLHWLAA